MPYQPTFEERQRWRWMNPAHERWAAYERDLLLPPYLRSVPETRDSWAWNYQRRAEAEAKAKAEAEEAERERAELIAEVEELRAHARRALAELKAENAAHQRREALLAEVRLAHFGRLLAAWRELAAKAGFNPDQPRVPAGNPDGGQWTSGESGASGGANAGGFLVGVESTDDETPANDFDLNALFSESSTLGEAQDFDSSPLRVADLADAGDPRVVSDALPESIFPPGSVVAQNDLRLPSDKLLNQHILRDHVRKTDEELQERIRRETFRGLFLTGGRDRNGSFDSEESARDFVRQTIDRNTDIVARVANGRSVDAFLTHRFGFETGKEAILDIDTGVIRMRKTFGVGVAILHDPKSEFGYRVISAFPRNYNPRIGR